MEILLTTLILILSTRTLFWHLQNWQIREYRFDRLLAHSRTKEGIINVFNLWFFKGILPRPKFTGRIFMILGTLGLIYIGLFWALFQNPLWTINYGLWTLIAFERTLFLFTLIAVWISKLPTYLSREILFHRANTIIKNAQNVTTIGIAGSYGKSSTKEILVHLLTKEFGAENVCFNPENQNNEVAIARLILKNSDFFKSDNNERCLGSRGFPKQVNSDLEGGTLGETGFPQKKFFVCEVGAYRRGEIAKVARFIRPKISLLTGLNAQHIELFGSQKNIQRAKFEMAEHTSNKVFFNTDNALLQEIFEDRHIQATKIALSPKTIKDITEAPDQTKFQLYGKKFTLPWPGKFFVDNALIALECARELGIKRGNLPGYLKTLPPLERALKITKKDKFTVLWDTYSANPDGVLKAIEHLGTFKGKKVFMGIPLKELGNEAQGVHQKIFEALAEIKADIYWGKEDFFDIGEKYNGKRFHCIDPDKKSEIAKIKMQMKTLKKGDVVLLEAKLPASILNLFQ